MKISIDTLEKRLPAVIKALGRRESIVVSHQGKELAMLEPLPISGNDAEIERLRNDPAYGMWSDHKDMKSPDAWVRKTRKGRIHAV